MSAQTARQFEPSAYQEFVFAGYDWEPATATVYLHYRLEPDIEFTETLRFPQPVALDGINQAALQAALQLLHWVAGVSYWKAACPPGWRFNRQRPDDRQLDFLCDLYRHGLAEFAFTNQLELTDCIAGMRRNTRTAATAGQVPLTTLRERCLVPLGGGKDSLVALEMVRQQELDITVTAVRPAALISTLAGHTGLPWLPIERRISPVLLELNGQGAWNGHVPITAVNACVLIVAAILYDFRWIVFANEASADEPTRIGPQGFAVNHQFSKSSAFEQALQTYIGAYISSDLRCFSVLRPLSELAICQRFAHYPHYHALFSSCNRQFHLDGARSAGRWCGHCPKCQFVFLALAPFLDRPALQSIFSANLLDAADQSNAFADLCGLGNKPFECVGSIAEARAAMQYLAGQPEWQHCAVITELRTRLAAGGLPAMSAFLAADQAVVAKLPLPFRDIYATA